MGRYAFHRPRDRAAERRGILAMALSRTLAEAEMVRDRLRSKLGDIERKLAVDTAMGHDTAAFTARLPAMRRALVEAEDKLDAARRMTGLEGAA